MSSGFLALLDDIAAIAKAAAATIDDVAGQTSAVSGKVAAVVIDDAAVTPKYITGIDPARELPMIGAIAAGSLKNKLLFVIPLALLIGNLLPFLVMPLMIVGGLYLAREGVEKIQDHWLPGHHAQDPQGDMTDQDPVALEEDRIHSAIRTDLILSAEIILITFGAIANEPFLTQLFVMLVTSFVITGAVYGFVALLVKLDDIGLHLVRTAKGPALRQVGRALVQSMGAILPILTVIGTIAMLFIGGGMIVHAMPFYHDAVTLVEPFLAFWPGIWGWIDPVLCIAVGVLAGFIAQALWVTGNDVIRRYRSQAGG